MGEPVDRAIVYVAEGECLLERGEPAPRRVCALLTYVDAVGRGRGVDCEYYSFFCICMHGWMGLGGSRIKSGQTLEGDWPVYASLGTLITIYFTES